MLHEPNCPALGGLPCNCTEVETPVSEAERYKKALERIAFQDGRTGGSRYLSTILTGIAKEALGLPYGEKIWDQFFTTTTDRVLNSKRIQLTLGQ